ncbi:reverse transcriptase domain-containing protein [Trichonephila inaurata madagascariensis]|uniref:Reverse transcriptase domain-containing protein n=1 Tax=Trichonephila inaurata madagascariensis TaxID=2747483 RepID=A0A8X6X6S2_9ARAC|nr:reverse transcriptase domain-containing protein [Trichonephila inaurata madagascariensis]
MDSKKKQPTKKMGKKQFKNYALLNGVSIADMNKEQVESPESYLGTTFDNRLSWKGHEEENAKRGEKRLSLFKRLAGVIQGSSPGVLSSTYGSYVRPVLDYGGKLLATASKSCVDIIDRIQNKDLRLISSAASTTPIVALEM